MPDKQTTDRAKEDLREGKSASTAAGEFVKEEMDHIRQGKHGAQSTEQAIAIGLSKARCAGVPLKQRPARVRRPGKASGRKAASHEALSRHAKTAAKRRGSRSRSAAAKKAARTRAGNRSR